MPVRTSNAQWDGNLKEGKGSMKMASGSYDGPYSFSSRFEDGTGTNPEELIAAAHAGCFSMALSGDLGRAGFTPNSIKTKADVHLEKGDAGFSIAKIVLTTQADVPGLDQARLEEIAEGTKKNCPVSRALSAVPMEVNAELVGGA
jgi:osmotically inducible protein OsmC